MALVPVGTMAALAATMIVKHYLADFVLQGDWMARGKERAQGWLVPLTAHAACHATLTLGVALVVVPRLWWLALVDFAIHFSVDRVKSVIARREGLDAGRRPILVASRLRPDAARPHRYRPRHRLPQPVGRAPSGRDPGRALARPQAPGVEDDHCLIFRLYSCFYDVYCRREAKPGRTRWIIRRSPVLRVI